MGMGFWGLKKSNISLPFLPVLLLPVPFLPVPFLPVPILLVLFVTKIVQTDQVWNN